MAGPYDFDIYQGDVIDKTIAIEITGGAPVDCTGASLRMQVRSFAGDTGTPFLDLTLGDGLEWTDAANGEASLFVSSQDTKTVPEGVWAYDLELVPAAGESRARKLIAGRFKVRAESTR